MEFETANSSSIEIFGEIKNVDFDLMEQSDDSLKKLIGNRRVGRFEYKLLNFIYQKQKEDDEYQEISISEFAELSNDNSSRRVRRVLANLVRKGLLLQKFSAEHHKPKSYRVPAG